MRCTFILLPNHVNFKQSGQFENLVFAIIAIRENARFVSRAPLCDVTKMKNELSTLEIKYQKEALVIFRVSLK